MVSFPPLLKAVGGGFMKIRKTLTALFIVLAFMACESRSEDSAEDTAAAESATATVSDPSTETTATDAAAETEKAMSEYTDKVAELKTSKGVITIRFFPDVAPNHVRNFIDLSQKGFYNGTKFHRTVPGFVIQGGDPNTKSGDPSTWGTGGSGQNVKAEFNRVHHGRGIVSMARSAHPDSASSQFFIVVADAGFLDNQYTAFGQVVSGMDAVDAIVSAKARGESPVDPVAIESVTTRAANAKEKGPTPK
jgi:cyclophilin family peptidyl-prolyl cis-trans isomerase